MLKNDLWINQKASEGMINPFQSNLVRHLEPDNQQKPDRNARILWIYQTNQLASPWKASRPAISIKLSKKPASIEAGNVQEYSSTSTFSLAPPIVPCFSKCVHWDRRKPAMTRRPIHFPCCSLVSLFIVSTTLLSLGDSARDSDFRARLPF